jgi:predicted site-specific integrase-resolvase
MISSVDKHVHLFYTSSMKLSQYAKQQGTRYRTTLRWFRTGPIKGYQAPSGTSIVTVEKPQQTIQKVSMYARVSSTEHRAGHGEAQDATG